jgi:hypothetical protein
MKYNHPSTQTSDLQQSSIDGGGWGATFSNFYLCVFENIKISFPRVRRVLDF